MRNRLLILSTTLMLTGCIAQSDIQAKYMSHENTCHGEAQSRMNAATAGTDGTYVAAATFSECMNREGWKVAVPKPLGSKDTAGVTPPIGPSTSGGIPGGSASGAAAKTAPPADGTATTTPASPIIGPGVQPSPAPAVEAVAPQTVTPVAPTPQPPAARMPNPSLPSEPPVDPDISTYQPARPEGSGASDYGRGAGRNF